MAMHSMEKRLEEERDMALERDCANEVCGCALAPETQAEYCSEYCAGEGAGRGEGPCQCGHVGCA
ncbi:MAG: hypothetical protein JO347_05615 [Candidatus Eremiobacteraeota bacterium]|nr:hypothetical protein [Candidatus Eremiobacteraeota bacterium]